MRNGTEELEVNIQHLIPESVPHPNRRTPLHHPSSHRSSQPFFLHRCLSSRRLSRFLSILLFLSFLSFILLQSFAFLQESRPPPAGGAGGGKPPESVEVYLERTGLCERLGGLYGWKSDVTVGREEGGGMGLEGGGVTGKEHHDDVTKRHDDVTKLNETVVNFCRKLLEDQGKFYRLRKDRVNNFASIGLTIKGEGICDNNTQLLIIIHSLHSYIDRRQAIRNTWGGAAVARTWPHLIHSSPKSRTTPPSQNNSTHLDVMTFQSVTPSSVTDTTSSLPRVRVAFIFGINDDVDEERRLRVESGRYRDIIAGDFRESYRNMTYKSLLGLRWAADHCPSAKYLFKCDDDMIVNIPAVWERLEATNMTWSIMGPLNIGSRVYRSKTIKWSITSEEYPFRFYPAYESGSGYAISSDLWRPLANAAEYVPAIFIDDVYVTGILGRILGVNHVRRIGFAYWTDKIPDVCALANGTVLTGTRAAGLKLYRLWDELVNLDKCPSGSENGVAFPDLFV